MTWTNKKIPEKIYRSYGKAGKVKCLTFDRIENRGEDADGEYCFVLYKDEDGEVSLFYWDEEFGMEEGMGLFPTELEALEHALAKVKVRVSAANRELNASVGTLDNLTTRIEEVKNND